MIPRQRPLGYRNPSTGRSAAETAGIPAWSGLVAALAGRPLPPDARVAKLAVMKIQSLVTEQVRVGPGATDRVPLTGPAAALPPAVDRVLVRVETEGGPNGLGFAEVASPAAAAVRSLIETAIAPLLAGEDPRETERLFARAEAELRPVGFAGLVARAYSAVDLALWDIKARAVSMPLYRLLGGARSAAPFVVSDPTGELTRSARPWLRDGATGVRVELGGDDVQADADYLRAVTATLGEETWVGVAAGGRFDLPTALALARFLEDVGADWFEDPLPADDEAGYALLAARTDVPLAAGAWVSGREALYRLIRSGPVRTVRVDVGRLGGLTPVLKVAAVAEACRVAVSPVGLPEVGIHLACGLAVVPHVEVVLGRSDVFASGLQVSGGRLVPPDQPGLGIAPRGPNATQPP